MSRPRAAIGTFPYRDHRTVAEIDALQKTLQEAFRAIIHPKE